MNVMPVRLQASYCQSVVARARERAEQSRNPPAPMMLPEALKTLQEHPDRYDPNRWLELFPHVRMRPGWVLDFVYRYWGNGGAPVLYARAARGPRRAAVDENQRGAWQSALVPDGSGEGIFETVVLARVAHRFHRVWHAFADNAEFICDRDGLRAELGDPVAETPTQPHLPVGAGGLTQDGIDTLMARDTTPRIQLADGSATITLLSVCRPGGLSEQTYEVRAGQPVRMTNETMLWELRGGPIY